MSGKLKRERLERRRVKAIQRSLRELERIIASVPPARLLAAAMEFDSTRRFVMSEMKRQFQLAAMPAYILKFTGSPNYAAARATQ